MMTTSGLYVAAIPVGARLVDTVGPLDRSHCAQLYAGGIEGIIAYLRGNLTPQLVDDATSEGLAVAPVNFSRASGWLPSSQLGELDARRSVEAMVALSLPVRGLHDWCDVEDVGADPTAYLRAWCAALSADGAGRLAGEYIGSGTLLGGHAHYLLPFVGYWRGQSREIPEPDCGFMLDQAYPETAALPRGGTLPFAVDYNQARHDFKGRAPTWIKRAA